MIAISSPAPMDRALEIARNQLVARESWDKVFSVIAYFCPHEPALAGPRVYFVPCNPRPTIKEMARHAAGLREWSAIINADIYLSPRMATAENWLRRSGLACAISRRLEFDPSKGPMNGKVVDWGLDFFLAAPQVWRQVAANIPEQFVIGKQLWDTWLLGFWQTHQHSQLVDLSPSGLVWHPKHENRGDFHMQPPVNDPYIGRATWPRRSIML